MLLDNKKIESYRERIENGNKYIDGPLAGIQVECIGLGRYKGLRFIHKVYGYTGFQFGHHNDLDIDRFLTNHGY